MSNNYNKHPDDSNNKNGKVFRESNGSSETHKDLMKGKTIDKKTDTLKLRLIYEELPDHCIQFFFLS